MKSILIVLMVLFFSGCEDLNTFCAVDTNTSDSNTTNPDDNTTNPDPDNPDDNTTDPVDPIDPDPDPDPDNPDDNTTDPDNPDDNNITYFLHEDIKTSLFWIGELGDDNKSAWDSNWTGSYGGVDTPDDRKDPPIYEPKDFTPKENPFYVALPYDDLDSSRNRKSDDIPWATDNDDPKESICKNRWVKITATNGAIAYAQWEDVGPFGDNDWNYVFKEDDPLPAGSPGLAISPAIRDYLKLDENETVNWEFVEEESVDTGGPWFDILTTSPSNQ